VHQLVRMRETTESLFKNEMILKNETN
jgi:hypothetical protein